MFDAMTPTRARFHRFRLLAILCGTGMIVAPVVGLLGTIFGMQGAFKVIETAEVIHPASLSSSVGGILVSTAAGLVIAGISLPLFIIFLVLATVEHHRLRKESPVAISSPSSEAPPP